ncbi:MAG: alanine racemase [Gammaproteobacteria bacterium]|nr:alanine racemase [Gammaproteobacteria bacterium]
MNKDLRHRAWAEIDLQALQANLGVVRQHNQDAGITAVIKSNGYGHGMETVAQALVRAATEVERFAVATVDEAVALSTLGTGKRILLLQGFSDAEQARYLVESDLEFVIHADYQLTILKQVLRSHRPVRPLTVWLKLDTGMHRLGLTKSEFLEAYQQLMALTGVGRVIVMSHLACADDPEDFTAAANTVEQLQRFDKVLSDLPAIDSRQPGRSLAASAGILAWPDSHFDHLRPGIMLYGGSPLSNVTGLELGLQPVMTLRARLIAIKQVPAGESIGYGATYTCNRPTRIGVVSIGYGDGYPRSAPTGTPVLVATAGGYQRSCLLGRVSMDMITIDLEGLGDAEVGDEVLLWGESLSADEVARFAGTISYELFCQVTSRVSFIYD